MSTAVILLGFGGPERQEDVRPFIERVVEGKNVPPARIDTVVDQYNQIGGKSPFNELTFRQARALQVVLESSKHPLKVYAGMLYTKPFITDVLEQATADGVKNIIAVVLAVHRTEASYERYIKALSHAITAVEKSGHNRPRVQILEQWHIHPLFAEAMADRIIETLEKLTSSELDEARMIFTAHSVPQEMSDRSGYDEQVQASAAAVASRVRGRTGRNMPWTVAYQSRSGPPNQPWLEPDIQHELAMSKKLEKTHVIVVPIGFVCDHVEVLFDLDVLAARTADELGMRMLRTPTVGDHPTFLRLLAELATDKADSFYAKPERQ